MVYKRLQMSQGVYFVTRGIAEAYVKLAPTGQEEGGETVKGIVSSGELFGYTRCDGVTV